jgi:uncharacterized protein YceH (UPF0502 family)
MDMELSPVEQRVLGCLIEKEMATPEYYPLTLNALVNACNQKSNRKPVMELDSATVEQTLYELRVEHKLAVEVSSSGSRVMKYRHCFSDHWHLSPAKMAIICELLVRGPQTPGDLRSHANRLHPLADSTEVEEILQGLETYDGGPFVLHMPKEPGKRERRWGHLFGGEPQIIEEQSELFVPTEAPTGPNSRERIEALETEIAELREELSDLKAAFQRFKSSFD